MIRDRYNLNSSDALMIEVVNHLQPGPGRWQPRVMKEAFGVVSCQAIPQDRQPVILQEAVNILSRCVPPSEISGQETGLVIGYVQSGKTMSFTTVAALAHDNGYRMVIIIAGTSQYLLCQSRNRLCNDLRINSISEHRPWRHVPDPTLSKDSHRIIRDILEDWNDPIVPPEERRTVLITVMKNHRHLHRLIEVLNSIELRGIPTLIIDDEGDQAGLNTMVRRGNQSTTYRRLLALRAAIPQHSFLQYTATPQAPLLINIVDVLSPNFAEVITPGDNYIGGRDVFDERWNLIRIIPSDEIPSENNRLTGPPQTLHCAMRLFFLGAAAHLMKRDTPPNRSMMVHPSRLTDIHGQYFNWVRDTREGWLYIFRQPSDDHAYRDLIELFHRDYEDLLRTEPGLPSFDSIVPYILRAMRWTTVRVLNDSPEGTAPVNWSDNPYWILVGGQSMDRGFTVEGLTVTYMPRGPGIRNADTIQQRARFFGYKQAYRGYCRIFLEQDVYDAFLAYIEHEEDIRSQLIEYRNTGRTLSDWRREFFLAGNLHPTRNNVIDIDYWRVQLGDRWVYPERPHDVGEVIEANRAVFSQFISRIQFVEHDGLDKRVTEHRNLVARGIPLSHVHENLLTRIRITSLEDSRLFSPLLRLIQFHLAQNPNDLCTIFLISGGSPIRRACENERIKQLFQGRQLARREITYPGDREVKDAGVISIQLRYLTLGEYQQQPIADNVPHLAAWIPASIARDMVQQPQGA
ncbi:MAG: alpha-1,4 polygalactosaminidase [Proteobacteria bacterium]|nr:alpha-1,4 polygalactosaminidase [Pseudomonadota bacterium]